MRRNKTKAKLSSGEVAFGVSLPVLIADEVELLAAIGFDYVTLDIEHEPFSEVALLDCIRAAESFDITPIVRTVNDAELILRSLTAGAQGVHVVHVNTAGDARRAVEATRFHPLGKRGFYSTGRNGRFGIGVSDDEYVEAANREMLLILQIEEDEGMGNLEAILATSTVDAIQFGPKDLRQSLGFADPEVVWQRIEDAIAIVNRAGRWVSMMGWMGSSSNANRMAKYGDLGVRMVTAHWRDLVVEGSGEFFERSSGRGHDGD
jgi:4-hydroxy-2-oxoheptanedioate aldolase